MVKVNVNRPQRFAEKEPFFSIIVVSYNYEKFLPRALTAIKKQTFKDYEIVIVDNGSTDNSNKLIKRFIKRNEDLFITHVHIEENKGLPLGRNKGIDNAHGKYLVFNDADDWMDKNCLEEMYKASENGTVDRIVFQVRDVSTDGKILQTRNYTDDMSVWLITLLQGNAFKRDIFEKYDIRVPDTFMDDVYISFNFNKHAKSHKILRKTLYNYFVNRNSTSGPNTIADPKRVSDMMEDMVHVVNDTRQGLEVKEWKELEYQLIKFYYYVIFHYNRGRKFTEFKRLYKTLHTIMAGYDKDYLKNPHITLRKNGDRLYGRVLAVVFGTAEKLHLMTCVLWIYALLSKFIYFNV